MTPEDPLASPPLAPPPQGPIATSREAAEAVLPRVTKTRRLVLSFVVARGEEGATIDEASVALNMGTQSTSARFNDLLKAGLIVRSGVKRRTRRKCTAYACVATAKGREALSASLTAAHAEASAA